MLWFTERSESIYSRMAAGPQLTADSRRSLLVQQSDGTELKPNGNLKAAVTASLQQPLIQVPLL